MFISPEAPPHPPRGLSPACARCLPSPGVLLGTAGRAGVLPLGDWSGCLYLYAGIPGLAIMMDSRWKRPSPRYLRGGEGELWPWETAAPHPCVCWLPKLQHSGDARNPNSSVGPRGNRHSQGSLARQGWRGSKEGSHTSTGCLGAAPSQWLLLDVAASISNRISSQQLHFKAFHSAALME